MESQELQQEQQQQGQWRYDEADDGDAEQKPADDAVALVRGAGQELQRRYW